MRISSLQDLLTSVKVRYGDLEITCGYNTIAGVSILPPDAEGVRCANMLVRERRKWEPPLPDLAR